MTAGVYLAVQPILWLRSFVFYNSFACNHRLQISLERYAKTKLVLRAGVGLGLDNILTKRNMPSRWLNASGTSSYTRTYVARRLVSARLVLTDTLLAHFRSNSAHRKKRVMDGKTDRRTEGPMDGQTLL